jgi:hypothetical protein
MQAGYLVARECQVDALAMGAAGVFVAHRADDRIAVGLPGQHGQQRTNPGAGHAGGDGRKFAAHLGRGVGLQIEGVHLGRAAAHEKQNTRLGLAGATRRRRGCLCPSAEQIR